MGPFVRAAMGCATRSLLWYSVAIWARFTKNTAHGQVMNGNLKDIREETAAYLAHFGLEEEPFSPTADPAFFCAVPEHRECLRRLWRCVDQREGLGIALGDFGAGKTTLLRKMAADLLQEPDDYSVAVLGAPLSAWTSHELLAHIVLQFGVETLDTSVQGLCEAMNGHLLSNISRNCVLLIDDAHLLIRRGHLELLRMLQTLETPHHKLLTVVCFAHADWMQTLQAAPGFLQHAGVSCMLEPITARSLEDVIAFRLETAGRQNAPARPRFTRAALHAVHAFAAGNLRLIMNACRNALYAAFDRGVHTIDHELMLETVESVMQADIDSRARIANALLDLARAGLTDASSASHSMAEERSAAAQAPAAQTSTRREAPQYKSERDKRAAEMLLKGQTPPYLG